MSAAAGVAFDLGVLITKIAAGPAGSQPRFANLPARPGNWAGQLRAVLADAAGLAAGPPARVGFAVPDAWLDGGADGARACEEMRHLAGDELGCPDVWWTGQLAAVAAVSASEPRPPDGPLLVCDVGGTGVRAALCDISGRKVSPLAVESAGQGGWRDFDQAVQALLAADGDPDPASWRHALTDADQRRAAKVLGLAAADPAYREARACTIARPDSEHRLSGGQLMDCFAETGDQLRASVAAVLGQATAAAVVVTGGLAWFPLVSQIVTDVAGVVPGLAGPVAAAHGALLLGHGDPVLAWPGPAAVTLPMHHTEHGLLADIRLALTPSPAFADTGPEPLLLDSADLLIEVDGRLRRAHLPGLAPGPYRIGVRPALSGSGLLVLRGCGQGPRRRPCPLPCRAGTGVIQPEPRQVR